LHNRNAPITTNTVISSKPLSRRPKAAIPSPLSYKPPKFQGAKTAGTPSLKELQVAAKHGTLHTNRKGLVTTPAVRKVSRALRKAQSKGVRLTGPLTPGQKVFAKQVAKRTGLNPRVVAAQALAEENGSYAAQREAEGNHNWLNIGYFDSGPGQLTQGSQWSNPRSAAKATARFLKGKEFGASEGIKAIIPESKGRGPEAQVSAIANSGWASSPTYKQSIEGTLAQVGTKGKPISPRLLQRAKALGLAKMPSVGPAPKKVVTRFKAIKQAAAALTKRHIPYVWRGGHGSIESAPTGLDCSGAVSWVLNKAGILKTPLTSGSMGEVLKPGPGAVTVFYNGEHTFMKIGNEYWGTSVGDSGAGGLGPHPAPSASYLAQYNVGHVPGLGKKQALQLGFSPTSSTSFPGMTLSSSGTTATIQPSAGTTQTKPGFSKSPIKLTQAQKARKTLKELASVGAGIGPKAETPAEDKASILAGLERKYGKAAV
jgi:cell wall-associated NlpC family hydrolase